MFLKTAYGLKNWLPEYLRAPKPSRPPGVTDILICVCDHFEPFHGTDKAGALARLAHWQLEFPKMIDGTRDADGCGPRHTFFYPIEQYDAEVMEAIAGICRLTGSEAEIHLHHHGDTRESLRATFETAKERMARHGLLSVDAEGRRRYGFIHGNWALDNSSPSGCDCGVSDELGVLGETGCYGDFTMPSFPDPAQTHTINCIYYALDTPAPKSHDRGVRARVLPGRDENVAGGDRIQPAFGDLLLVQGPLGLNWERRKMGVLPRVENGDLTAANPPRPDRLRIWLRLGISVMGRPEWKFIKLHTHGGIPGNYQMLLGEPMRQFHRLLRDRYNDGQNYRLHYVSARELVNIVHAAEDGHSGNPGQFRDYRYRLTGTPATAGIPPR